MWRVRFLVEGSGSFPYDMLRYDSCHPVEVRSVDNLVVSHIDPDYSKPRQLWLETFTATREAAKRTPTLGRWLSFDWRVIKVDSPERV